MQAISVLFLFGFAALVASAPPAEEKLAAILFKDYNKNVNPGSTPLTVGLSYLCADLNKENLHLTSRVLEKYTWQDSRLTWTPKEHNDLKALRYPARHLWTPDFKLYNSQKEVETRDEVNAVIYSNGTVLWVPIATYHSACLPVRRNVFHCSLTFGTWTYDAGIVGLNATEPGLDKIMYLDTCPYSIIEPKVEVKNQTYPCCGDEKYATMYVNFLVQGIV